MTLPRILLWLLFAAVVLTAAPAGAPKTGPATEKRFPPLQLPPGFQATLFACDPFIEYPSAIAAGPRPGTLFVAIDYMTGLGTEIVRRDEVRLLEDTDGDGYADRTTVVADGFNSIMGLTYHDGTLHVMHAPFLTSLRVSATGKADQRKDLLSGLGLPPEKNPVRLHCANGVVRGYDGWLYLALGDNGVDVPRPEGDRLVLHGGGILRCRPDGRDLHIFARGLRNIYDIALDAELNVFVRDNENDGGTYMVRLCHSFHGADHGYPYLYHEHPREALPPLGDFGLGSSAGGACYLEAAFPTEYRGGQFWCEWGKAVMFSWPRKEDTGFAAVKESVFASGAANDPYGFKPTDIAVGQEGALYVADWCDGQRPKRGRGRIYRITSTKADNAPQPTNPLNSASYSQRVAAQTALEKLERGEALKKVREALDRKELQPVGRLHAVWILANKGGPEVVPELYRLAREDNDTAVRIQAIRALADLTDPLLQEHKLEPAGRGPVPLARDLVYLAHNDVRLRLDAFVAVGRMRWAGAPDYLAQWPGYFRGDQAALDHAFMLALRRADNWPAVIRLLNAPRNPEVRPVAQRALAGSYQLEVVDALLERLDKERGNTGQGHTLIDLLCRVHRKPGPWVYWGYRPPPRPANTVDWERTGPIAAALNEVLTNADASARQEILTRLRREKIPVRLTSLQAWLVEEQDADRAALLLEELREHPAAAVRPTLLAVIRAEKGAAANRSAALRMLAAGLDKQTSASLLPLAESLQDGPLLAEVIGYLGRLQEVQASALLLKKTESSHPMVREAALDALADLRIASAREIAVKLLHDSDSLVRRAAVRTVGKLEVREAAATLLQLASANDLALRRDCLQALTALKEAKAVPLAANNLIHPETSRAALLCLQALAGPEHAAAVVDLATRHPTAENLEPVADMLARWSRLDAASRAEMEKHTAQVQGVSGVLLLWQLTSAAPDEVPALLAKLPTGELAHIGRGPELRVTTQAAPPAAVWLAATLLTLAESADVQFLAGSNGPLRLWLDGKLLYQRKEARSFQPDSDRFDASLAKGSHRLIVEVGAAREAPTFHVRFRRKSSSAALEQFAQLALTKPGNAERGRKLFFNVAKTQCLKCHRLDNQGDKIGPDLTGVGRRFARAFLIESVLEPSRSIAPGYQPMMVEMTDGRVLTGLPVQDTLERLTLADSDGKIWEIAKKAINARQLSPRSIMPDGLERQLSAEEFVDLIAFLASQK